MRKHPKVSKFMYEAFYATPEELKPDINKFKSLHQITSTDQKKKIR